MFPTCRLWIRSSAPLEAVAEVVSQALFGGLPFGGLEDALLDEVPTVYIKEPILGWRVLLCGDSAKGEYELAMRPTSDTSRALRETPPLSTGQAIDITYYVQALLRDLPGIQCCLPEPVPPQALAAFEALFATREVEPAGGLQ